MNSLLPLAIVLSLACVYGIWYQRSRGVVKEKSGQAIITESMIGSNFGPRATLVQFSSAFCTPCKVTRVLLENVAQQLPDVVHVEIDAEANLELVRELNILSTPTTLFLDAKGREVGRAVGAPKREQVVTALAAIRE